MIKLRIKDSRNGEEKRYVFDSPSIILGRKATHANLVLNDDEVSKRHCEIGCSDNGFYAKDLASSNGSFLNGKKLEPHRLEPFKIGDGLEIGAYLVTIDTEEIFTTKEIEEHTPTPTPAKKIIGEDTLYQFKKRLISMLFEKINIRKLDITEIAEVDFKKKIEDKLIEILKQPEIKIPVNISKEVLINELIADVLGFGPIEEFLKDQSITEVMVNRPDQIYVEKAGKLYLTGKRFFDEEHIRMIIERIIQTVGRRIDESQPYQDARLPDGSRVHAIIPPLALNGPTLTIRKFSHKKLTAEDLIKFGSLNQKMAKFLETVVKYRANVLVSGGTGSGKTTLLNILSNFISDDERIITVEDSAELKLNKQHVISLEHKPPNIEGKGEVTIRDLVKNTLRMRPDRIVVGECRSGEALDMLQAMNTGHDGSLTTIHANTPRDTLKRLETLVMMAGMELPSKAIKEQIQSAINFIVQTARLSDGSRKVTHITEITGMEGEVIATQDIFIFKQEGFDETGKIRGNFFATGNIPKFFERLRERGIPVDMEIFKND
ncbi:MAG: ATPase, T2SS/T4P/T4SS family [candidate division WOR-3 bacterium]